jgi:tricarballylate dehydrogenase
METLTCDVVVVGAGNAAMSSALAAREKGADVLVLERAPEDERGGNSRFTAGIIRTVFNGVDDLEPLFELNAQDKANSDFGSYTVDKFYDDLGEVTQYRTNPDLAELLVTRSYETVRWLVEKGVKMQPSYGRQAFKVDGKFKFWGGLAVETWGGGPGLIDNLYAAAKREGIKVLYDARATKLIHDDDGIHGVVIKLNGKTTEIRAKAVILACGGFEANSEMRTKYLGPGWELAAVRGTRFNTGDGITMALEAGAQPYGNWSGCHAVAWDMNAPEFGDLAVGDGFQKHCYPWGLIVNADGKRFVDEGAHFRNYTYAKYGKEILNQPGKYAYQVFDKKIIPTLRDEYRIKEITKYSGNTIEELASKIEGVNKEQFVKTIHEYNAAVQGNLPYNPAILDGNRTEGLAVDKTNWALRVDEPPFEAYGVGCGVTFTFGGLRINTDAQVIDSDGLPMRGLYAAGELVGGLFYFNYPGGSGLMSGAVFGRIAGTSAAVGMNHG